MFGHHEDGLIREIFECRVRRVHGFRDRDLALLAPEIQKDVDRRMDVIVTLSSNSCSVSSIRPSAKAV
ncbi:MAG TPA: hypothetical protein VLN61_02310 [Pseudolabrys sp.]|nr:hypothetical protein [Pseudolabrys sp.]